MTFGSPCENCCYWGASGKRLEGPEKLLEVSHSTKNKIFILTSKHWLSDVESVFCSARQTRARPTSPFCLPSQWLKDVVVVVQHKDRFNVRVSICLCLVTQVQPKSCKHLRWNYTTYHYSLYYRYVSFNKCCIHVRF